MIEIPSLLYPDAGQRRRETRENAAALSADLNLTRVLGTMARGDAYIRKTAGEVLLSRERLPGETVRYRQTVLRDFITNPAVPRLLYAALSLGIRRCEATISQSLPSFSTFITVSAATKDRIALFRILFGCVRETRAVMETDGTRCASAGVFACFSAFAEFFSDRFMREAQEQLDEIEACCENAYARVSAGIGPGLKGDRYVLQAIAEEKNGRHSTAKNNFITLGSVNIQTQAGRLRDAALTQISHALKQVNDATLRCLKDLRYELAFYLGGVHLNDTMADIGAPVCYPDPAVTGSPFRCEGLVDIGLAIENARMPVGNSFRFDDCRLLVVTGANQGGKSTFLRSVGEAYLMMQCGLFVAAEAFSAAPCGPLYTHFCRAESAKPDEGRLGEELARMDEIVEHIGRDGLILMNESFSTTSEREAAAIAEGMLQAVYDSGVRAIYVTHFYELARVMEAKRLSGAQFLAAQRNADGTRPYRLTEASPQRTSFAMDIYRQVFGL